MKTMKAINNEKIGWGQLGIVLALSRIFSEAANFPSHYIRYGMQRFTVIFLSYLLLAVMLIPIFIISRRENRGLACPEAVKKITAVLLSAYLFLASVIIITRLQFYASSTIFDAAPPWLLILFTGLICLYGIFKGLQGVIRTGVIVAAAFVALIITVIIGIGKNIRVEYLYPALIDNSPSFLKEVIGELSKNVEAVIFASIYPAVRSGRPQKPLFKRSVKLCRPYAYDLFIQHRTRRIP